MTAGAAGSRFDPPEPSLDLTVCIVSYRCRDTLLGCLESLSDGLPSFPSWLEVSLVDNCSEDGTVEAVRERFPTTRVEALSSNQGFARAANQAVAHARGRYLLLLNPDVRTRPATLRSAMRILEEAPRWGALGIRLRYPDGRIQGTCGHFPDSFAVLARSLGIQDWLARQPRFAHRENLSYFCFPDELHEVDAFLGAFLLVARSTWEQVGGLDEQYFLYGEDLDWCRRARRAGVQLVHQPALEAVHAQGSSAARVPFAALRHFHRSAVRYHRIHERADLPLWLRPLARASLTVRHVFAVCKHVLHIRPGSQVYLTLRADPLCGASSPSG